MIAVDLLMCIASGTNWLAKPGKRESTGHPVAKTGVLLIDLENGAAILKQRLAAFTKAYDRGGKETNFFGLRCRLHGLISVSRKALLC